MSAIAVVVLVLGATGGTTAAVGRDAALSRPCPLRPAQLLGASKSLRVWRRHGDIWVCDVATRRRSRIPAVGLSIHNLRIAGHLVAFEDRLIYKDVEYIVRVFHVRPRHESAVATGDYDGTSGTGGYRAGIGPTTGLELRPDGNFAYIARNLDQPGGAYQVQAVDGTGHHKLDDANDIDPRSLAANAGGVYWARGGTPHFYAWQRRPRRR